MNHKVLLRSVFVAVIALAIAGGVMRMKDAPEVRPVSPRITNASPLDRPLACYRVLEEKISGGIDYLGANFRGRVAEGSTWFGAVPERGARFADAEFMVEFGAPRVEQGAVRLECPGGRFVRPGFGVAQLDRGAVIEEYLFENRRVEQIFRFPAPVGEGALRLSIPVKTDLQGPVIAHAPNDGTFKEIQFLKGGLAFCDDQGKTRLAYHSAVAIDAKGREFALAPRHESNEIVMEIPSGFMADAAYPLVIDPWLDFAGSGFGGGISNNSGHSQTPALALTSGGQPFICWADDSAADPQNPNNTDIYMKWWNGFEFFPLANSLSPGGISDTPGKSSNPTIGFGRGNAPIVAWEDDTSGAVCILLRKWPHVGEPNELTWASLAGSGLGQGVSFQFAPAQHPTVTGIWGLIPGIVTTDPQTGVTTSTPSKRIMCPVVAYDLPFFGATQIVCQVYYPGAPPQPVSAVNPQGLPEIPEGWYPMGTLDGQFVDNSFIVSMSQTPSGAVSQYPSIVSDELNRVALAWQDTRNGNYEIYVRQWNYVGAGSDTFQVIPNALDPINSKDLIPPANFDEIGTSATGGGVSSTATPSQFPSLARDGNPPGAINLTVGWQETEAAAPPNPGTTSQIYVERSVGGAAFAGVGGSSAVGGISQTLNQASNPSLDVNGQYIGVAWADDSNSRSSIYVRRLFLGVGGSGLWEQVGFQGSAFPTINAETFAPIDGISKSLNFSIQPKLKLDQFGSPIVAWSDGSGATFDILMRVFSPNGPGVATGVGTINPLFNTALRQTLTDPRLGPAVDVGTAGFANGSSIFLSSRLFTEDLNPAGTSLRLELEVQPQGFPFTNSPTFQTLFIAPDTPAAPTLGNLAVFRFDGLPNANYKWQARSIDQVGRSSPWIQFPTDAGGVSFRINAAAPPGGGGGGGPPNVGGTVGSSGGKDKCGLTGLEGLVLLGSLLLFRRRRSR